MRIHMQATIPSYSLDASLPPTVRLPFYGDRTVLRMILGCVLCDLQPVCNTQIFV